MFAVPSPPSAVSLPRTRNDVVLADADERIALHLAAQREAAVGGERRLAADRADAAAGEELAAERDLPAGQRTDRQQHVLGDRLLADGDVDRAAAEVAGRGRRASARARCRSSRSPRRMRCRRRWAAGAGDESCPADASGLAARRESDPQAPARSRSASSATCRSPGVVILRFSGGAAIDAHRPARALDEPGVVGRRGEHVVGRAQRPLERRAAEHLRRLHGPQRGALERAQHDPAGDLLDRVGDRRGGDHGVAVVALELVERGAHELRRQQRPSGVVDDDRIAVGGARARPGPTASGVRRRAPRACPAGALRPAGSATTIVSISATARSASMLHSSIGRPANMTNALGSPNPRRSPRPAATTSATATSTPSRRRCRRGGRRDAARPPPRPCRARTSARTRGSSSRA